MCVAAWALKVKLFQCQCLKALLKYTNKNICSSPNSCYVHFMDDDDKRKVMIPNSNTDQKPELQYSHEYEKQQQL